MYDLKLKYRERGAMEEEVSQRELQELKKKIFVLGEGEGNTKQLIVTCWLINFLWTIWYLYFKIYKIIKIKN